MLDLIKALLEGDRDALLAGVLTLVCLSCFAVAFGALS